MKNKDYIPFYKIASQTLGRELIKQIDNDEEILEWLSREGWLMFPLPNEKSLDDVRNRLDPNIYIQIWERENKSFISMGIEVNTLASVEKIRNILDSYHENEKNNLLSQLKTLDDTFLTIVSSKIKEHYFAEAPRYEEKFTEKSNKIDDVHIKEMFLTVKKIREDGLKRKELMGTSHPVETPVIDLAHCTFPNDTAIFSEKLKQIKPVFETCLAVKKTADIKRAKKEIEDSIVVSICVKCHEIVTEEEHQKNVFCSKCGSLIKKTKRKNIDESYRERN